MDIKSDTGVKLRRSDCSQAGYFRFYLFLDNKTGSRFFLGIIPYMFVRKSTIVRRMSGPSKIVGVLPVLSGPVDKVDLRHIGLKSHSQGLQKILLRNELEKCLNLTGKLNTKP